jgi:hypothetical protein
MSYQPKQLKYDLQRVTLALIGKITITFGSP